MTREEAIKALEHERKWIRTKISCSPTLGAPIQYKIIDAINLAIEALEKQIPHKIAKDEMGESAWVTPYICPVCQADIIKVEFMRDDGYEPKEKVSYCWRCGQAIDWSDDND